jgi:predicted nucleic acid-binding protein
MHARDLVELAALVSVHGPVLIESREPIPPAGIERYWTASKVRLDRWAAGLKRFVQAAEADARRRQAHWPLFRGVLEEILSGEMLTRVWTAVLCAYDRRRHGDEAEPAARSVLIGHMEARHRVLTLMVRGPGIDAEAALGLNRIRRRTERWTDLLVGHLAGRYGVGEFAFDPPRAGDFAQDFRDRSRRRGGGQAWPLVLASVGTAFRRGLGPESPNAALNARIAAAILSCFPADLFDSTGLMRSLWLMRLRNVTEDAQVLIEDLLALEHPADTSDSSAAARSSRQRRFGG